MIKQFAAMMAATAVISAAAPVYAAPAQIMLEVSHSQMLRVTNSKIIRIAIANPNIADVAVFDKENVSIIGKLAGSTTLMVWTADGMRQDFTIVVKDTDESTAQAIKAAMHLPDVEVEVVGTGENKKILLTGFVEDQNEMDLALNVASLYVEKGDWSEVEYFKAHADNAAKFSTRVNSKVINNIQMRNPKQINLSILVLDVGGNNNDQYGFQYANASAIELPTESSAGSVTVDTANSNVFFGGDSFRKVTGRLFSDINGFVQAVTTKKDGKVLSRPDVTTMSGKEASLLIGGQIPVQVIKDQTPSTEWKDYGIRMHIQPTIDTQGNILTNIDAEVSSLDYANAISNSYGTIPALTTRTVSTSVVIPNGQTMAIGGLMNNDDSKVVKKFPILGDIPIIGEFFKHTTNKKDRREIVILVTPTLINTNSLNKVKVSEKAREVLNEGKRALENRSTYDLTQIPNPNGGSKSKK